MTTDNERCEAVRRLRSVGLDDIQYSDAICEVMMCAGLTCVGGDDCHGSDERPECVVRVFSRLADLIEPDQDNVRTVSGNIGTVSGNIGTVSGIDRDSLLALADEIEDYADGDGMRFGRVVDRDRAKGYARRIREALG